MIGIGWMGIMTASRVKVCREGGEVMKAVVDRFEGEWAVLLVKGQVVNVPKDLLPAGAKEGDHLDVVMEEGQVVKVVVDEAQTNAAWQRIRAKVERLRRGDHLK